VRDQQVQPTP